jgi:ribonuclease toxin BrnT of type II toxin-antitoxin system
MRFEWDAAKSRSNEKKHGVSFEEARKVFDDQLHIALLDRRFGYFQERWITIGSTENRRIVSQDPPQFRVEGARRGNPASEPRKSGTNSPASSRLTPVSRGVSPFLRLAPR